MTATRRCTRTLSRPPHVPQASSAPRMARGALVLLAPPSCSAAQVRPRKYARRAHDLARKKQRAQEATRPLEPGGALAARRRLGLSKICASTPLDLRLGFARQTPSICALFARANSEQQQKSPTKSAEILTAEQFFRPKWLMYSPFVLDLRHYEDKMLEATISGDFPDSRENFGRKNLKILLCHEKISYLRCQTPRFAHNLRAYTAPRFAHAHCAQIWLTGLGPSR